MELKHPPSGVVANGLVTVYTFDLQVTA